MIWGTGLSPYVSTHAAPYYWPGKNQLGALLLDLTQKLFPDEAMDHDEHKLMRERMTMRRVRRRLKMHIRRARRMNMMRIQVRME